MCGSRAVVWVPSSQKSKAEIITHNFSRLKFDVSSRVTLPRYHHKTYHHCIAWALTQSPPFDRPIYRAPIDHSGASHVSYQLRRLGESKMRTASLIAIGCLGATAAQTATMVINQTEVCYSVSRLRVTYPRRLD